MSDAKAQQEPSMEEILASIRRIISEDADGQKPAAAAEPAAPPPAAPEPEDDDILDLTDRVNDDGSVVSLHRQDEDDFPPLGGKPSFSVDDGADDKDIAFDHDEFSQALMSGGSSAAAASAFAQLEQEMSVPPRASAPSGSAPLRGGSLTIEQLVMDAVRPLLKDWLDQNLPGMVENLVRSEIERVAQTGRRR